MQEVAASYAVARSRNISRYRSEREKKCAAMRAAKARMREELWPREPSWQPPALRRIVVVIDLDSGRPRMRMMQLWRGDRVDTYRVRTPKGESKRPVGWSRALAAVRKGLPRAQRS